MSMYEFEFKGGVSNLSNGGKCKFLLFLLNGSKEVSLSQAVKYGIVEHPPTESIVNWTPDRYVSKLPVIKILLLEDGGFGKEKLNQSLWLVLGKKLEKQIVTIKPRLPQVPNYRFNAEASFMKKSEVLALVDKDSLSAKVIISQQTPPVSVLKQIISIERIGLPQSVKLATHGGVRKLRIR